MGACHQKAVVMKIAHFLVPGVFLLILGMGNLGVGHFKRMQYDEVLKELSQLESSRPELSSPLARIEEANRDGLRLYHRQKRAQNRRDFYDLVEYGGKVFTAVSILFFVPGVFFGLRRYLKG